VHRRIEQSFEVVVRQITSGPQLKASPVTRFHLEDRARARVSGIVDAKLRMQ
jgi:hypothetical protein